MLSSPKRGRFLDPKIFYNETLKDAQRYTYDLKVTSQRIEEQKARLERLKDRSETHH